jgi:hypothetical protein
MLCPAGQETDFPSSLTTKPAALWKFTKSRKLWQNARSPNFANEFKEKAKSFENSEDKSREVASEENKKAELKISSLSSEESKLIEQGLVPKEKATEIFAKKAFASFKNGIPWAKSFNDFGAGRLQTFLFILRKK